MYRAADPWVEAEPGKTVVWLLTVLVIATSLSSCSTYWARVMQPVTVAICVFWKCGFRQVTTRRWRTLSLLDRPEVGGYYRRVIRGHNMVKKPRLRGLFCLSCVQRAWVNVAARFLAAWGRRSVSVVVLPTHTPHTRGFQVSAASGRQRCGSSSPMRLAAELSRVSTSLGTHAGSRPLSLAD